MAYFSKPFLLLLLSTVTLSAKSQVVNPPKPYSAYRVSNGLVFISGQIGVSQPGGKVVQSSFETEVNQVIKNIKAILDDSGSDLSSVINVVVYLKDMSRYAAFNRIYLKYFNDPFPSRSCVAVKELAGGANIEVTAIAVQKKR